MNVDIVFKTTFHSRYTCILPQSAMRCVCEKYDEDGRIVQQSNLASMLATRTTNRDMAYILRHKRSLILAHSFQVKRKLTINTVNLV